MPDDDPAADFDLASLGHELLKQQEGSAERRAYLEKLRKQFESGEYRVDTEALADKLLEDAADEILPRRHRPEDDAAK